MKKTAILQLALVLAIALCSFAPNAHATMGLMLFDNLGNCVEVTNPGAAATGCPGASNTSGSGVITSSSITPNGKVTVDATLGVWTVNVSTGLTKPILGTANVPRMDLNTTDTSSGAGVLTIWWGDTDFLYVPGTALATSGGTTTDATSGVKYNTFTDSTNALFGKANPMTSQTFPPYNACFAGTCFFGAQSQGGAVTTSPYSMLQEITFTTTGATQLSGDFHLNIVPEPASVALLGGVLLFTATAIRRRFKRV